MRASSGVFEESGSLLERVSWEGITTDSAVCIPKLQDFYFLLENTRFKVPNPPVFTHLNILQPAKSTVLYVLAFSFMLQLGTPFQRSTPVFPSSAYSSYPSANCCNMPYPVVLFVSLNTSITLFLLTTQGLASPHRRVKDRPANPTSSI
jgi:hypothetical protein